MKRISTYWTLYSGGRHCFGFNILVDYFDQSSFKATPGILPFFPSISKPKSGCYALALPFFSAPVATENTDLKQSIYNFTYSFISGINFSVPDNSQMSQELIYESQDGYDKAYFSAQWVNPQCKWVPSHFRHKASPWGDLTNFFSSLFF